MLHALISAVDAAAARPDSAAPLRAHLMRASDGSHYVAYTIDAPTNQPLPERPAIYVRLATANVSRAERSPIREWLTTNQQTTPTLLAKRGIALGEMPIMGPTGSLGNQSRQPMTAEAANLQALDLERRRARERQEERERQRRQALEGRATTQAETLPFEDFDFVTVPVRTDRIQRALTSGPGEFDLYVAWLDPAAKPATPIVVKKRLSLPPASTTELSVSSVILADGIQSRAAPYPPTEQASHPYAIGPTEILPAADASYRDDENLSVVFQVINAAPGAGGKPNIDINYQVVRVEQGREQAVASLTPQNYSERNLPSDFDLRVGHPLFATVSAPLATLKAGSYRLKIVVTDAIAGRSVTTAAEFNVTATAAALLREAPPLGVPFRRETVLHPEVLPQLLTLLRPAAPSPTLQRAFDLAASGKFVELMVEEQVPDDEAGVRAALRGIAGLAVGDGSSAVQFQRAQLLGAPLPATRFLSGAARAAQSQDAEAIAAWQEALKAGVPRALVVPRLLDAYLRRNDLQRATPLAAELPAGVWFRSAAALLIASSKFFDAVTMLEARVSQAPEDADAQWLLLHAMYGQLTASAAPPALLKEKFLARARAYIDGKGVHAAIAAQWLNAISSS